MQLTDKLIARPNNEIPPLLSAAEFVAASDTAKLSQVGEAVVENASSVEAQSSSASISDSIPCVESTSMAARTSECSEFDVTQCDLQSKSGDETQTASEFLPDKTYYYNSKNSYIFPGAELWWKDSDNDSVSSDSSSCDDDDVASDIEIENIRNELEQSYTPQESSQLSSTFDTFFTNEQMQKDNDLSSCSSSNPYDNTTISATKQTIHDHTFAHATEATETTASHLIGVASSSLPDMRKRSASASLDDVTSSCASDDTDNAEKRIKLSQMLLLSNND